MKLYDRFLDRFEQVCRERGTTLRRDPGGPARSRNLIGLKGGLEGYLYVRPSPSGRVWSIAPDVARLMPLMPGRWALVLPWETEHKGFCVPGDFIGESINEDRFETIPSTGQLRITDEIASMGGEEYGSTKRLHTLLGEDRFLYLASHTTPRRCRPYPGNHKGWLRL